MLKGCICKENDCKFAFFLCVRDSSTCEAVPKRSEGMSREDGEVWIARPLRLQSSRSGNANLLFLRRFRLF